MQNLLSAFEGMPEMTTGTIITLVIVGLVSLVGLILGISYWWNSFMFFCKSNRNMPKKANKRKRGK